MELSNNTILITGGTSGIGLAFAIEVLKRGNTVIICGRREDRLATLKQNNPGLITRVCDVSRASKRTELATWATENYPALNILMNNAGMQLATNLTEAVDLDKVENEIETNLVAPIHLSSIFAQNLSTLQTAAIINISSGLAFSPLAHMPVYCATKAAVHSFTLSLRHQLRKTSVKVFEVAPPSVDTELGHQQRVGTNASHGGIPVEEFLNEAMDALRDDILEAPIGMAKMMREKREGLFEGMNARFS